MIELLMLSEREKGNVVPPGPVTVPGHRRDRNGVRLE